MVIQALRIWIMKEAVKIYKYSREIYTKKDVWRYKEFRRMIENKNKESLIKIYLISLRPKRKRLVQPVKTPSKEGKQEESPFLL